MGSQYPDCVVDWPNTYDPGITLLTSELLTFFPSFTSASKLSRDIKIWKEPDLLKKKVLNSQ